MKIVVYGSSLVSAYWNGAATYYRGIFRALAERGYEIVFCEPDAFDRQANRDMDPPPWARVIVWQPSVKGLRAALEEAARADVVIKASGVGVFDNELVAGVLASAPPEAIRIYWDVDAPATLATLATDASHPLHAALPAFDHVFTYGGGDPVVKSFRMLGARDCEPVYNALDPQTHGPVPAEARFRADLSLLANRLPDREARIGTFFFAAAARLPDQRLILGGSGWEPEAMPANVSAIGHVGTRDHNAFNCSARAVLNVTREDMAANGYSPATRVFEAAGAGACLISDDWPGLDSFLEPGREVLPARDGQDVAAHVMELDAARARAIGEAARTRILKDHTYTVRAAAVDETLKRLAAEAAARPQTERRRA